MMAQEAPLSSQKTMMAQPAPSIATGGTKILPDSAGVVAYATERAQQARHSGQNARCRRRRRARSSGSAWIVLGIGVGLGIHFYLHAARMSWQRRRRRRG